MSHLFSYWHFDFITLGFVFLLCTVYFYVINFKAGKKAFYFSAGILLLLLSASSPFHFMGENYMFSRHMAAHVLILLIAAPLLAAGIPSQNRLRIFLLAFSKKMARFPFMSWLVGVGIMWFWHFPYIFNRVPMMDQNMGSGISMYMNMLSLLIAGFIFSWPIINPYLQYRIAPSSAVLYLSTACAFCSLLGLLITFAPAGTYTYNMATMHDGLIFFSKNNFMSFEKTDLQTGGLIMWVPCCIIYLSASMYILVKWFDDKKEAHSFTV